jgi:lycopene beta-cyclase
MTGRKHDIVVAGGGLSGGLIALALTRMRPDLSVLLIEGSVEPGGDRRQTWLGTAGLELLDRFRVTQWQAADFAFPGATRRLAVQVNSMAAEDFAAGLKRELPKRGVRLRAPIARLSASSVVLENGEEIGARAVIDCRGFVPSAALKLGWRAAMERQLLCAAPHRVSTPMLVDAGGEQGRALAFAQVLPLGVEELIVSEHRVSASPTLDRRELSSAIEATCTRAGWQGDIPGGEASVRPLLAGGNLAAHYAEVGAPGVALAGSRGLFLDPLTGSSLEAGVEVALAIGAEADLPGEQLAAMLADHARKRWRKGQVRRRLVARLLAAQASSAALAGQIAQWPEASLMRLLAGSPNMADRLRLALARA